MTISKSESGWFGTSPNDIDEYLRAFAAGGYPVQAVAHSACAACRVDAGFTVSLDDDQGAAVRTCLACNTVQPMLDSGEFLADAELEDAACPSGHEEFDVAVGYAFRLDGEVRWISVGLRCRNDGQLGVYTDWKIDYSPSRHLLDAG